MVQKAEVLKKMNNTEQQIELSVEHAQLVRETLIEFVSEVMCYSAEDVLRLLKREQLNMPLIGILSLVRRNGASSISEISNGINFSLANTSMMVDKLVGKGLVTRVEDPRDRRHKVVQLTKEGEDLIHEYRLARVEGMVQRVLGVQPELQQQLIDVLQRLAKQLPPVPPEPEPERS
jgi:DNA-binding MarR family transcriptional regulator